MNEMTSPPSAAELPPEYRARLASLSLLPAWTLLRAVMPVGAPVHQAQAKHWCYRDIRPELLRAGQLVTAERAERRVLAFVNPGIDPARMSTMPSIFFGLQLILPGERAPNHRHVPAAARIIVEGEGAYTTVNDEKIRMEPGDIVFTPPHRWHDHGHEGVGPGDMDGRFSITRSPCRSTSPMSFRAHCATTTATCLIQVKRTIEWRA